METTEESNSKISETGKKIREKYPELSTFDDEMTGTIPGE